MAPSLAERVFNVYYVQSTFDIRIMSVSSYLILISNVILISIGTLIVQYSLQKQYTVLYNK